MPGDDWANAIKNLTGYPMPERSNLFQELSGSDGKVPLMNVTIETFDSVTVQSKVGPSVGPNVDGHSYVLAYYTQRNMGSLNLNKITIDFLWNPAERPARPGTPLDNYIFGPLNMLNRLVNNPFSTQDGNYGGLAVDPQNVVKLRTFSDVAGAYDRSYLYFRDQEEVLKKWAESLGHEDADMRGTAADAFAALIRRMEENFKGYKEQLRPEGFSPKNFALYPVYGQGASQTKPGDALIGAANAVHQAGYELVQAWHNWAGNSLSNPMQTLNKVVYDLAVWIQGNNIGQVLMDTGTNGDNYWMAPGPSFWQDHPTYGNLSQLDTWTRIGNDAIKAWNDFLDSTLVPKGTEQMSNVNNAFISATADLVNPLATRNTSPLGSDNKGGNDGKGGGSGNESVDDILNKLGLGGDDGDDGANGDDGKGGNNNTRIPPPDLNNLGGDGNNGANGADGRNGNGNQGGGDGGLGDPNRFLANVPPPGLNNPGGGGSGLNTPDGLPGGTPGGLPGSTGSGGPGGTGNPRTLVSQPAPDLGLPDMGTPGSGTPGSGLPSSRLVQPDLPELGGPGSGLSGGSGLPGTTNPDGTTGPNGTTVPVVPGGGGGSRLSVKPPALQDWDGSGLPTTFPDGSSRTVLPDGSSVTTSPDGTKVTRRPDGTILTEQPDGTKVTTTRDGTTTTEKPDGSKKVLHPGGIVTLTSPDGETSYLGPDGKPLGDRPDVSLTTPPLPSLSPPGLDLPGVGTASGYDTAGGGVTGGGGGGTLESGSGNPLQATTPRYEEAGYDVSTDFPGYGVNALGGSPDLALGGTPNGGSPTGTPMMPGMGGMGGAMGGAGGMGGGGAGGMGGGDRVREFVGDPAGSPNRMAQNPNATGSGTPPYMPPAGGQNGNGQQTQSNDRERANWLAEEEDVWGTEDDVNPAVLGRAEPGTSNGSKNAFMTGESR
ncbi:AAWKG family protein [Streptomyces sp. NPDC001927]